MHGISIVTPSLNQAQYLEQCIDSILSQNYPGLEYIIMDGGSTDGSVEIIKKYEKHLSHWQSRPDGGQYQALNAGFSRSTKPIMCWLNADDMLHHGGLAAVGEVFSAFQEVEFLTGKRVGFDINGDIASYGHIDQTWCHTSLLNKDLVRKETLFIMQEATFWRRTLWEKAGSGLDTSFSLAADFELWLRMSRHAALHTVNALTGGFRCYSMEQRCNKSRDEYVEQCCRVIDREVELDLPPAPHRTTPPPVIDYPIREKKAPAPFEILTGMERPKITIVTPSFNQGEYLEECIDSVLSQNYPNLEYIVMDGGSTDGSADIIRRYGKHLHYWHSRRDHGQYHAVNTGFAICTGEIMAWLNSDDKYHPGALWLAADAFGSFPELRWLTGSPTLWDKEGNVSGFSSVPPVYSREKYLRGEIHSPYIQQESTFWRRSLWYEAGGCLSPDFPLAADLELWARFFRFAPLQTLHAPLGGFRSHPGEGQRSEAFASQYAGEAERIVARERALFGAAPPTECLPPLAPLTVPEVAARAGSTLRAENFAFFSYSRSFHFAYFARGETGLPDHPVNLKGLDICDYQELLIQTFLKQHLRPGARVLLLANGCGRIVSAAQGRYEFWQVESQDRAALLPPGHFDLAIGIAPVSGCPAWARPENARRELARILKPGALVLYCFEILFRNGCYNSDPLLPHLRRETPGGRRLPPLEQVSLDPFAFALGTVPQGIRFSYQLLWRNDAQRDPTA